MKNKRKPLLFIFTSLIAGSILFSSCETSRVGPELPRPNTAAPAAQPVLLKGYVKDDASGSGIGSAVINLKKTDETTISTTISDAAGSYQFNLTTLNVSDSQLKVATTVSGYGYGYRIASVDVANNSASVSAILLTKITSTTTSTVTPASGGTVSAPATTESKTSNPVTVSVPANAVPTNTAVTISAVPVKSTPVPTTSTQNIVASANLQASGVTTFTQPVTITFSLPLKLTAGSTIPLIKLNTTTNLWELTSINATISTDGLTAVASVTTPGQYALLGNVGVTKTVSSATYQDDSAIGVSRMQKVLDIKDATFILGGSTLTATFDGNSQPSYNITLKSGDVNLSATDAYILSLLSQRFGVSFTSTGNNTHFQFNYNLPSTLTGNGITFSTTQNGVQVGPPANASSDGQDHTSESGDWMLKIIVSDVTAQDVYDAFQTGVWDKTLTSLYHKFQVNETSSGWFWQPHNQGSLGPGPF